MKPGKHQKSEIRCQDLGWKVHDRPGTTVHNLLFCSHTLCMNYVTNTFLLVSSSVRNNNFCVLWAVKAKENKNLQQKNFVEFLIYCQNSIIKRNLNIYSFFLIIYCTLKLLLCKNSSYLKYFQTLKSGELARKSQDYFSSRLNWVLTEKLFIFLTLSASTCVLGE